MTMSSTFGSTWDIIKVIYTFYLEWYVVLTFNKRQVSAWIGYFREFNYTAITKGHFAFLKSNYQVIAIVRVENSVQFYDASLSALFIASVSRPLGFLQDFLRLRHLPAHFS